MNFKKFLKGGMISAISVIFTLALVYAMKSDFIEAKMANRSLTSESQDNDFAASVGPTENFLQTGTAWDLFDDYESWPSSTSYLANDTLRMMLRLTAHTGDCGYWNKDFVDINGDGLVDLLYFYNCPGSYSSFKQKYAVLTNHGDDTFSIAYKCAQDYTNTYYGDCAAL